MSSNTDRSEGARIAQLNGRPCCSPRNCPPPTTWSYYPAKRDVDIDCNRIVDVSGIGFCDGTYLSSGIAPQPTAWSQYPATQTVDLSCNRIVDVSSITFCDGTYIGTGNSFDISSSQVLVLSGTADPSGSYNSASIVSRDRIYQQLDASSSWNTVNGYYALAKDSAPALNPNSSGVAAVSSWSTRTVVNNAWRSVCWSPELGIFVAVSSTGTGNRAMTSSDGIVWTARSTPTVPDESQWYSVCWSAELRLFVAVAIAGTNRVMTSSDGIVWTTGPSATNNQWFSVCWSPELRLFVAVAISGTNDRVMTSSDGITWTVRTTPNNNNWTSVCWSPELGKFVAVSSDGSGDRIMISSNGITWTTIPPPNSAYLWNSVCWSAELGIFVAVATSDTLPSGVERVMTSPDGITWTMRSTNTNIWRSVCWSAELGIFVAVASSGSGNRVMTSPDGVTWTLRTTINNAWRSVCWSPELGIFVAVASDGSGNNVMTSSLRGRPPTAYNVFDSSFNRIDQSGNWTIQQVLKSGTYTAGATTPSVAGTNLLYISNGSPTKTITNFTGGVANQQLTLVFNDSFTTVQSNTNIRLSGGNFTSTQFDTLTLLFTGTEWVELSRSVNA